MIPTPVSWVTQDQWWDLGPKAVARTLFYPRDWLGRALTWLSDGYTRLQSWKVSQPHSPSPFCSTHWG